MFLVLISILADFLSIIGFFITLFTFLIAFNVKKQIIHRSEIELFRKDLSKIIAKLEGFEISISEDNLHTVSFLNDIDRYITDINTKYSFLSRRSKRHITLLKKQFACTTLTNENWRIISTELITLKNNLNKEI